MNKPHIQPWRNPTCPICCHTMSRNGTVNGNLRYRCRACGFNETENSIAHNANVRTSFGVAKRISINSNALNRPSTENTCTLKERCSGTDGSESTMNRVPSDNQAQNSKLCQP